MGSKDYDDGYADGIAVAEMRALYDVKEDSEAWIRKMETRYRDDSLWPVDIATAEQVEMEERGRRRKREVGSD